MTDQIVPIIVAILVLAVLWGVLKAILKLTKKVFSCGLFLIIVNGGIILLTSNLEIF